MTFTINYEDIIKDSLKNAIKKVLLDVSLKGLPGDHHFFISFINHPFLLPSPIIMILKFSIKVSFLSFLSVLFLYF